MEAKNERRGVAGGAVRMGRTARAAERSFELKPFAELPETGGKAGT